LGIFYILNIQVDDSLDGRISIFGENQNIIGLNLSVALILMLAFFNVQLNSSRVFRFILLIFTPFVLLLLFKTGSRLGFISFFLALLGFGTLMSKYNKKSLSQLLYILLILVIPIILFWGIEKSSNSDLTLSQRIVDSFKSGDLSGRDIIWAAVIPFFLENMFIGIGMTGYTSFSISILGDIASPHNGIIEALIYTGIIGTFFFILYLYRLYKKAFMLKNHSDQILPFLLMIPVSGILLSGQIFDSKLIWLIMGYVASLRTA
jgi:O-antigen ligase